MTRKDYKAMAAVIGSLRDEIQQDAFAKLVWRLGDEFANENSLFDMDKWQDACGLTLEFINNINPPMKMVDRFPHLANI